jgi:hypothetical protein
MKTTTLYRPVGEKEMILIMESGFKNFLQDWNGSPFFILFLMKNMLQRLLKNGIQETKSEIILVLLPGLRCWKK